MSEKKNWRDVLDEIERVDSNARLLYSTVSRMFYVSSRLVIVSDGMRTSICIHAETPEKAVIEFYKRIQEARNLYIRDNKIILNGNRIYK